MPVKRDRRARPKTALELATEEELEAMLTRRSDGELAPAARNARIRDLARDLAPEDVAELDRLVRRRRRDRTHAKQLEERSAKARRIWAERSHDPAWVAEWDRKAAESHRRYDRTGERPALTGEELHHLWHVMGGAKAERKAARRLARDLADLEAERIAEQARRDATQRAREADAPLTPPAPARALPEVPAAPQAPGERRRRRSAGYGVVAQFDLHGNRVI